MVLPGDTPADDKKFRSVISRGVTDDSTNLKLAEEEHAVSLLLEPREELVQENQLARVPHEVLLSDDKHGRKKRQKPERNALFKHQAWHQATSPTLKSNREI